MADPTYAALGQLTTTELDTALRASQQLLRQTDPDLLSPLLRTRLGELYGRLDEERTHRKNLNKALGVVPITQSPHDES